MEHRPFRHFSGSWKIQAVFQFVATLVVIVQGIITVNTAFNKEWVVHRIPWLNVTVCPEIRIELLSVIVVFFGLLISVLYTVSNVNCLYWLGIVQQQYRDNILRVRELWCRIPNVLVLGATCVSVFDAFWFFLFVREVWTYRFDVTLQVLQLVPSLFIILGTIFNGLLICAMSLLDEDQQAAIPRNYRTDIDAHMGSNILLAMYAAMSFLVAQKCHGPDSTFITEYAPLFVVFELICRNFLVYHLGHSRSVIQRDRAQEELHEIHEDEILNEQPHLPENEDHMINEAANEENENPELHDRPLLDEQDDNDIDPGEVDVDVRPSDDSDVSSLSSYTGSANDLFPISEVCSEDAEIDRRNQKRINSTFVYVSILYGEEFDKPFPNIELED